MEEFSNHRAATSAVATGVRVSTAWYQEGLRFECTRCGNCCGGGPGMVRVTDVEIEVLAERLGVSEAEFRERYTRAFDHGIVLLKEQANYDCIFYDSTAGCTVYEHRPRQSRSWPFWEINVVSRETWDETAKDCPGIDRGPLHMKEVVAVISQNDGTTGAVLRAKTRTSS